MSSKYTPAVGVPDLGEYIPRIFAATLLVNFYAATVFGAIANTDFEGQVKKFGDELVIRTLPDITVGDYSPGMELDIQTPDPGDVRLLIDKGKYWAIGVNDVQRAQSDISYVDQWAEHASKTLKTKVDLDVLANIYASAHASNKGATAGAKSGNVNLGAATAPLVFTSSNAIETIVSCNQVLDEQNVPPDGRWIVIPAWMASKIKGSDIKNASVTGDGTSVMRNGQIGQIDNMTIYRSNQLATATDTGHTVTNCIFGHKVGLTFAAQLLKKESLRNPKDFGDLIRGLMVYGYKVTKPEAIGHLYTTPV